MSFTRGQFCKDVLIGLGNMLPSQCTINFMIGWTIEESGHDLSHIAAYNLMNTTLPLPGSTVFNFANVQNYTSYAQGIQATVSTIAGSGFYPFLVQALRTNDCISLGVTGTMLPGVARDLSVWVSGQRDPIQEQYVGTITAVSRNPGTAAQDVAMGTATTTTGQQADPNDPCTSCGTKGSDAYNQCLASIAVGVVPNCAYAATIAQQQTQNNQTINQLTGGANTLIQAIQPWIQNPTRIIKLVAGILLIGASLFLLTTPEAYPIANAITSPVKSAQSFLKTGPKN